MVIKDAEKNELRIEIRLSGVKDLVKYQKALLSLLRKIEIEDCDESFHPDLLAVYELLSHILMDNQFPNDEIVLDEFNSGSAPE